MKQQLHKGWALAQRVSVSFKFAPVAQRIARRVPNTGRLGSTPSRGTNLRGVTQLGRALALGARGHRFEAGHPDQSYVARTKARTDAAHQELTFRPENFLSRQRSKALDDTAREARMSVLAMCSEIASVALLYLPEEAPAGGRP